MHPQSYPTPYPPHPTPTPYPHTLPPNLIDDHSRVKLREDYTEDGRDYINASFIVDTDPQHPAVYCTCRLLVFYICLHSDGVGRTGTYILIDMELTRVQNGVVAYLILDLLMYVYVHVHYRTTLFILCTYYVPP